MKVLDGPGRRIALVGGIGVLLLVTAWFVLGTLSVDRLVAPRPTAADAAGSKTVEAPVLPASALAVPVRVDIAPLIRELEAVVPGSYGDLENRLATGNDRVEVAIELQREPFAAAMNGGVAEVTTTVHYRVRGWYDPPILPAISGSCGTDEGELLPRLSVTIEAPVTLTPDWRLSTQTRVARIAAASDTERDRCEMTFLGLDMTDRVAEGARSFLEGRAEWVDSTAATANLRASFESWWGELLKPISLDDQVWLVLDPSGLTRGPIVGSGDVIEVPVTLSASPRIVLGPRPDSIQRPLPPLESGAVEPGLDILVEGRADYATAGERLTTELAGTVLERVGRSVEIESVELFGIGGGQIALEVEINGDVEGRLYLVGEPVYDPASDQISVPDLAFDIATSDLIVSGASWLADHGIEDFMRRRAHWTMAPVAEWAAEQLRKGLNRPLANGVSIEGSVDHIRILAIQAGSDAFRVYVSGDAEATLVVASES